MITKHQELVRNNLYLRDLSLQFRDNLLIKPTHAELTFITYLKDHQIKYEFQKVIYIRYKCKIIKFYIADFYIPEYNLIIELDGDYHSQPNQYIKDKQKNLHLRKKKYWVLRLPNWVAYNPYKLEEMFIYADKIIKNEYK